MVATRFVIHQTAPASLALLRYAIGFCCLLPPALLSGRVQFERRDLLPIGLLGITQFGILIALLNYALQFIKMCQNTPQLCWGDEWPTLSPGGRGLG